MCTYVHILYICMFIYVCTCLYMKIHILTFKVSLCACFLLIIAPEVMENRVTQISGNKMTLWGFCHLELIFNELLIEPRGQQHQLLRAVAVQQSPIEKARTQDTWPCSVVMEQHLERRLVCVTGSTWPAMFLVCAIFCLLKSCRKLRSCSSPRKPGM